MGMIENYYNEDNLKPVVNAVSFYVMLFEHFQAMVIENVRDYFFLGTVPIINGELYPTVNDEFIARLEEECSKEGTSPMKCRRLRDVKMKLESYKAEISDKEYIDNGGKPYKDVFRASLEWLHEHGAISGTELRRVNPIRKRRNDLVHYMFREIGKGFSESDARMLGRLFNIYLKVDNWFAVNDLSLTGCENTDGAQSVAGTTLLSIFRILFLNEGEDFKNALRENGIDV